MKIVMKSRKEYPSVTVVGTMLADSVIVVAVDVLLRVNVTVTEKLVTVVFALADWMYAMKNSAFVVVPIVPEAPVPFTSYATDTLFKLF